MKKFLLICMAVVIVSYLFMTSAFAQSATFNYSVTFDIDDFKDCQQPLCQLLSLIWERSSDDIQNCFDSLAYNKNSDEAVENNIVNVNINISHSSTWSSIWHSIVSSVWPESTKTLTPREKNRDIREEAEQIAREILEAINTSGDLYYLDFVKDSDDSKKIFVNNDISKLTFFEKNTNFLDSEILLDSLKKICSDDLVVRSNKRFMCAPNIDLSPESLGEILHDISEQAVFSSEKLQIQSGDFDSSLHEK